MSVTGHARHGSLSRMKWFTRLTPLRVATALAATGAYVVAVFVLPVADWLYPRDERRDDRGES